MEIAITWHGDNFNIDLSSRAGEEAFLSVKGARIVDGAKGPFISYPSRKQDNGKYWNHVWGSDRFNAVVMQKAQESRPQQASKGRSGARAADADSDIPF